jgi:O-Antigen ligase
MREHLVAFVYIMVMACAAFVVMAKPLTAHVMTREDFARRRNLWLAVTAATFLAHDFWLAMLACALIVGLGSRRDPNPVAVYCALLFAVPQFPTPISGFGVINQLFEIDHPRMLALVLLLPAALRLAGSKRAPNPRLLIPDTLFVAYFLYTFIVTATAASVTELMRHSVYLILDHALLYYVITRSVVDRRRLIDVMASFVMAVAVISVVAVFENVRHWLVYESLRPALGVPPPDLTLYLMRATEDGGYMRALTTAGNSIAMGFMAMIAITLHLALLRSYKPRLLGAAVVLMLVGGLLAAVSRGPWMGCAIAVVVGIAFGPGAKKRLLWMLGSLPLIVIALLIVPQGQKFIDLLPFIGTVEPGSVTYRTQLIDRAMIVFWQNPIFGSLHYIHNPVLEVMRQGQGIIDIVNSYIGVALPYGLIGLALFVAPAAYAVSMAALTSQRLARSDPEGEAAGRALAASMLGILIVIGALSLIVHVPIVHWMFVSLCVAFAANAPNWRLAPVAATRPTAAGRALPQRAGQPARPSRHHA